MSSKARDLITTSLIGAGIVGAADARIVYATSTGAAHTYWNQWVDGDYFHSSLTHALESVTESRNDVILLTPGDHNQGAQVSCTGDSVHIVGMSPNGNYPHAVVKPTSTTGTTTYGPPFFKIEGRYSKFTNFRLQFGNAQAADTQGVRVHGRGNVFENVRFEGPVSDTHAQQSDYQAVVVGNKDNVFRDCVFGVLWPTRTTDNCLLRFQRSSGTINGVVAARETIFERCTFTGSISGVGAHHIDVYSEGGGLAGPQYFRSCLMYFHWSDQGNTATTAIRWGSAGLVGTLMFDSNCNVFGATDIISGTIGRQGIIWGHGGGTLDTATLGIASNTA